MIDSVRPHACFCGGLFFMFMLENAARRQQRAYTESKLKDHAIIEIINESCYN